MTQKVAALLTAPKAPTPQQAEQMPPAFVIATIDQAAIVAVMPATARELVDAIGFDNTLDVLRKFGGKKLFIPTQLVEGHTYKLVEALGLEIAEKLVDAMGGTRLEPPMMASVERLLRDNAIRKDYDAMCAAGERFPMDRLVDRYGITQRHIRKLLKASVATSPARPHGRERRDTFTMDLFNTAHTGAFA